MSRATQSGFMLFELMLVVALVLICSTIGFMSYTRFKGTSIATDVSILNLLLRSAATRAVCLKKEQKIIIDQPGSALVYDGTRYALQDGYSFGVMPDTYGPPSAPQKIVTHAVTFVDKKISAYPDGTLQSGTLYITDGNRQYALTTPVSAFSYIRVYQYNSSIWQSY